MPHTHRLLMTCLAISAVGAFGLAGDRGAPLGDAGRGAATPTDEDEPTLACACLCVDKDGNSDVSVTTCTGCDSCDDLVGGACEPGTTVGGAGGTRRWCIEIELDTPAGQMLLFADERIRVLEAENHRLEAERQRLEAERDHLAWLLQEAPNR